MTLDPGTSAAGQLRATWPPASAATRHGTWRCPAWPAARRACTWPC